MNALSAEVREHLADLEANFLRRDRSALANLQTSGGPDGATDFDVVLAGGGLSLIYAAYLARAGLRVAVFDKRQIGCTHREWNISRAELGPLTESGLFTAEEVAALVELEYDYGVVRWHGGKNHAVRGVLDCVINAQMLLDRLRTVAEGAGAKLLDRHAFAGYRVGRGGIAVHVRPLDSDQEQILTARLLVDAMGAQSPHAAFDLVCPTVGGVLGNLQRGEADDELNPRVGDILVSTEGVDEGRQHIWEGFPQPGEKLTTYLFYYAEPERLGPASLERLYERFFATLPRYKRGEAQLEKATYGFIPAYTRLRPMPAAPCDRVVLVGDAAGRHSPLTFCGFGSMIRSFFPVARALVDRLERNQLGRRSLAEVWSEPPSLQVMGGLTLMMVDGRGKARPPGSINRLLDAAFTTLSEMGNDAYAAFVRDETDFSQFMTFMQRTADRHPTIYREVFAQLSPRELMHWSLNLSRLAVA